MSTARHGRTKIPEGHDEIVAAIDKYFSYPGADKYAYLIRETKMSVLVQKKTSEAGEDKVVKAIELAVRYGGTDEMHHLRWVVDQMVRVLAGENYESVVKRAKNGEDGPDTYEWHTGIAP